MKPKLLQLATALVAAVVLSAPLLAEARPGGGGSGGGGGGGNGGGSGNGGGGWNNGGHGGGNWNHGGNWNGHRGGWYGGWGPRGYWGPGYFWGGLGFGLGLAAIAYPGPWYGSYGGYGTYGTYYVDGYYPYGSYSYGAVAPGPAEYVVVEPAPGQRVLRSSGQPVPPVAPPDPIFYPRNGQSPAQTETDRQACNRWATTQPAALNDASIFQRATFACMEGRGYTVK